MTPEAVYLHARTWVGVPFRKIGRSRTGVDCLGLGVVVARHFDVPHVDELHYSDWPDKDRLVLHKLGEFLRALPAGLPRAKLPGTIGCFAEGKLPGHIGIFSLKFGQVHVIHARAIASPPAVVEESWAMVGRDQFRLVGLFCFPTLELEA